MVNLLNVDISELKKRFEGKDKLESMFELVNGEPTWKQRLDLNVRKDQLDWKERLFALTEELFEATDALPEDPNLDKEAWEKAQLDLLRTLYKAANVLKIRPWVKTEYTTDYNHLYDELADSIWFFINLLKASGLSPEKSFEILLAKIKVNDFRKQSGY